MDRLVLFDIDKTLTKGGVEPHYKAFQVAFLEVYGVKEEGNHCNFEGMTDKRIITEVLKTYSIDENTIRAKIDQCMELMGSYYMKQKLEISLMPGVEELLDALNQGYKMGLVTGNIEPIARHKMESINLNHLFLIGGFGNESTDRADLVRNAVKRAEDKFGTRFTTYLFGDTIHDIKAGIDAGVTTIALTTGNYSADDLSMADHVLPDLRNTDRILGILKPDSTT